MPAPQRSALRTPLAVVAITALLAGCGSTVQTTSTGQLGGGGDGLSAPGTGGELLPGTDRTTGGLVGGATGRTGVVSTTGDGGTSGTTGTTGGGTTGAVRPGTTGAGPIAVPAGPIPTSGPGWDAKFVYVGVNTQKDVSSVAQGIGAKGLDTGDQEGQAKAVIAYLNKRGGLFGRQVKAVFHDNSTVDAASDPDSVGAVSCGDFTQDRKVIAVLNPVTLIDTDTFRACLAKSKVPLLSASVAPVSQAAASRFAPYFYQSTATTWDALAPVLVRELVAAKYFSTAWDTNSGRSIPGKAKVGILAPDTPDGVRTAQILDAELARVGSKATQVFRFSTKNNNADMSSAVLQFRSNGVDHVIGMESSLVAFQSQAQGQGYRPRYGIHTLNAPITFLQANGGPTQNHGDVGVGWAPSFDVDDAHDPGQVNSAIPLCDSIMKAGGQTYSGKRLARTVAYAFCDGLRLIAESAQAGGGFTGVQIYNGVLKVAPSFESAFSFSSGLKPGRLTVPGGVRPLAFDDACACFVYTSKTTTRL